MVADASECQTILSSDDACSGAAYMMFQPSHYHNNVWKAYNCGCSTSSTCDERFPQDGCEIYSLSGAPLIDL